jgi:multidrug efflux pump subunit AcrB
MYIITIANISWQPLCKRLLLFMEEYIRVELAQADTAFRAWALEILNQYYVRNTGGCFIVLLSTVISYKPTESAPLVSHYNLFRTAEINGGATAGLQQRPGH